MKNSAKHIFFIKNDIKNRSISDIKEFLYWHIKYNMKNPAKHIFFIKNDILC